MTNSVHKYDCERKFLESKAAREAWETKWPKYCRKCHGLGGFHHSSYRWDEPDSDEACSECVEKGRCPRCGRYQNTRLTDGIWKLYNALSGRTGRVPYGSRRWKLLIKLMGVLSPLLKDWYGDRCRFCGWDSRGQQEDAFAPALYECACEEDEWLHSYDKVTRELSELQFPPYNTTTGQGVTPHV